MGIEMVDNSIDRGDKRSLTADARSNELSAEEFSLGFHHLLEHLMLPVLVHLEFLCCGRVYGRVCNYCTFSRWGCLRGGFLTDEILVNYVTC